MSTLPKTHFTPEEYLAMEISAEYKSQYVAGEIFAMAGAEPWHTKIVSNLVVALGGRLRGRPCDVYSQDMCVQAKASAMYTYPDVVALCGEGKFDGPSPQSLTNPQVIFEVLSPGTEGFDRGEKFARYRRIETLVDYVLVASTHMHVEHHVRQPNGVWTRTEHGDFPGEEIRLASLGCALPLAEVYERVNFPPNRT